MYLWQWNLIIDCNYPDYARVMDGNQYGGRSSYPPNHSVRLLYIIWQHVKQKNITVLGGDSGRKHSCKSPLGPALTLFCSGLAGRDLSHSNTPPFPDRLNRTAEDARVQAEGYTSIITAPRSPVPAFSKSSEIEAKTKTAHNCRRNIWIFIVYIGFYREAKHPESQKQ